MTFRLNKTKDQLDEKILWRCGFFALLLLIFATPYFNAQAKRDASAEESHAIEVQMPNVLYHFTDNIAVHIRRMHGELIPT